MKILFSTHHNPHFFTVTEYIEAAIRKSGHELCDFEDRQHILPGRIRASLPFLDRLDRERINKKMLQLARHQKPDVAVIAGGHRILPETIQILKGWGIECVLWTIDAPIRFQPVLEGAPFYDHVFCQGTEAIELFEKAGIKGARWLPMACDPDAHRPVECTREEKRKYGCDTAFVGSYYPARAALFEHLAASGSWDLAIWGPGWEALKSSALRKQIKGLHTRPEEWLKIYSASKIVLSSHYHDPQDRFPVYQASPRVFEILACGAFQLCDDQRDVFALFQDGRDLVKFTDGRDLVAKVQYYLAHPQERIAIATQGRKTVLSRHTYQDRVKELLTKIGRDD